MTETRLSKYLSSQGLCSRREADRYIEAGWVTVDGEVVREAWFRVSDHHTVELSEKAQATQNSLLTIILNKPLGVVSAQPESGQTSASRLITPASYFGKGKVPRLDRKQAFAPAGRLDINSTGLLVLTQDGRVARQLIGNDNRVEKEYLIRHTGVVSDSQLEQLRFGLSLDDKPLKRARVQRVNREQIRMTLMEGRKRQIRRMCEAVDLQLKALKRVRIGNLRLGDLPPGKWRLMQSGERF